MRFDKFFSRASTNFLIETKIFSGTSFYFVKQEQMTELIFYDPATATSRVLVNIFQNFGIKSLTGDKKSVHQH